jgi:hypothetical protein
LNISRAKHGGLHAAFNLERRWCCAGIHPHLQQATLRGQQHRPGVDAEHPVSGAELVMVEAIRFVLEIRILH